MKIQHDGIERELRLELTQQTQKDEFTDDFQKLLLNGPVMSDEQFEQFKDLRKEFNEWIGD